MRLAYLTFLVRQICGTQPWRCNTANKQVEQIEEIDAPIVPSAEGGHSELQGERRLSEHREQSLNTDQQYDTSYDELCVWIRESGLEDFGDRIQQAQAQGDLDLDEIPSIDSFLNNSVLQTPCDQDPYMRFLMEAPTDEFAWLASPPALQTQAPGRGGSQEIVVAPVVDIRYEKYRCKLCYAKYKGSSSLSRHMKSKHMRVRKTYIKHYLCEICTKEYSYCSSLRRHRRENHPDIEKEILTYACEVCKEVFLHQLRLYHHKRTYHRDFFDKEARERFTCRYCSATYANYAGVSRHTKRHHPKTGETYSKGVEYEVCKTSKYSHESGSVIDSEPIHCEAAAPAKRRCSNRYDGFERRFTCKLCGLRYTYASGLCKHTKRKHSKDGESQKDLPRPSGCVSCGKPTQPAALSTASESLGSDEAKASADNVGDAEETCNQ